MPFICTNEENVCHIKEKIRLGVGVWQDTAIELERKAEYWMEKGPWSVTFDRSLALSGDPHDYYSEAPYWWPDPKDPAAPYIRRDGILRPDRFEKHMASFHTLADALIVLTAAGHYLDKPEFLKRAAYLAQVWFVDEETRMNPNVEYGEAIINICPGRNAGIIVLRALDRILHSLGYLSLYEEYNELIQSIQNWCRQMMEWLLKSNNGLAERKSGNNHTTWWNTHVAACAAFCEDDEVFASCVRFFKEEVVGKQIEPDGSLPRELKRTRSLHYSLFNLEAMTYMCELAYYKGEDLWHYVSADERSVAGAIEFLVPALKNNFTWKYEEIVGERLADQACLQLASLRLGKKEYLALNEWLRDNRYLIRNQTPFGPLVLMPGFPEELWNPISKNW